MVILGPVLQPATGVLPMTGTKRLQRCTAGLAQIGHDHFGATMLTHCFPERFQRGLPVTDLRDKPDEKRHREVDVPGPRLEVAEGGSFRQAQT